MSTSVALSEEALFATVAYFIYTAAARPLFKTFTLPNASVNIVAMQLWTMKYNTIQYGA